MGLFHFHLIMYHALFLSFSLSLSLFLFFLFILRPTTGLLRNKAFFLSGSERRAAVHSRPVKSKNTFGVVGTHQRVRPRHQETNNKQLLKQLFSNF